MSACSHFLKTNSDMWSKKCGEYYSTKFLLPQMWTVKWGPQTPPLIRGCIICISSTSSSDVQNQKYRNSLWSERGPDFTELKGNLFFFFNLMVWITISSLLKTCLTIEEEGMCWKRWRSWRSQDKGEKCIQYFLLGVRTLGSPVFKRPEW